MPLLEPDRRSGPLGDARSLDGAVLAGLTAALTAELTADRLARDNTCREAERGPVRQEGIIRDKQVQDGTSELGWH